MSLWRVVQANVRTIANLNQFMRVAFFCSKDVTHTGQFFAEDDYRNVRFTDRKKLVNPNFSINLIKEVPPKPCTERIVACDGGHPALGHPKVYINLDQPGNHACGYCGLRYYYDGHHH